MDTKAWEELFHGCKNAVERFVYFKIPAKADAEDVIQEVFLTAFQKFSGLKDPLRFKAWILSIARSKCCDYFRQLAKAAEISEEDFKLRGHGDLFGTKQSGDMTFKIANLKQDYKILIQAKKDSQEYLLDTSYDEAELKKSLIDSINHN